MKTGGVERESEQVTREVLSKTYEGGEIGTSKGGKGDRREPSVKGGAGSFE